MFHWKVSDSSCIRGSAPWVLTPESNWVKMLLRMSDKRLDQSKKVAGSGLEWGALGNEGGQRISMKPRVMWQLECEQCQGQEATAQSKALSSSYPCQGQHSIQGSVLAEQEVVAQGQTMGVAWALTQLQRKHMSLICEKCNIPKDALGQLSPAIKEEGTLSSDGLHFHITMTPDPPRDREDLTASKQYNMWREN